jgi:hypothetical protein
MACAYRTSPKVNRSRLFAVPGKGRRDARRTPRRGTACDKSAGKPICTTEGPPKGGVQGCAPCQWIFKRRPLPKHAPIGRIADWDERRSPGWVGRSYGKGCECAHSVSVIPVVLVRSRLAAASDRRNVRDLQSNKGSFTRHQTSQRAMRASRTRPPSFAAWRQPRR